MEGSSSDITESSTFLVISNNLIVFFLYKTLLSKKGSILVSTFFTGFVEGMSLKIETCARMKLLIEKTILDMPELGGVSIARRQIPFFFSK